MYLFEEQDVVDVKITCKMCLKEIKFPISAEDYQKIEKFPFKREIIHGTPKHKLVVYINKNLEIDNFKLEDIIDEEAERQKQQEELTRKVLTNIGLTTEEVQLYFRTTGRDAISLGELSLLIDKPKDEVKTIADKFVEKGLFKEIVGATPHYSALPPYAALVGQLEEFASYIKDLKEKAPSDLRSSFSQLEAQADGIKNLKDYTDFMLDLKQNTLSKLSDQRKAFDQTTAVIDEIKNLTSVVEKLESDTKEIMATQIDGVTNQFKNINEKITNSLDSEVQNLTTQFKTVSEKISRSMDGQVKALTSQFEEISNSISEIVEAQVSGLTSQFEQMKTRISSNLQKLRLGVLQQAVDQVIERSFSDWISHINENLTQKLGNIEKIATDGLVKTRIALNRQISDIKSLQDEGLQNTKIILESQVNEIQKIQKEGIDQLIERINEQLIARLKESLDQTINNVSGITSTTSKTSENIKNIFEDISQSFSKAITMADEKLGGISEKVFESFDDLRDIFSTKIINTLNETLNEIIDRIEMSEQATRQFWEKAISGGGAAGLTMTDVWFIQSPEGAKAHINDELVNAKMRVLIVAPQITDVSLKAIQACRSHINIRIAANIDIHDDEHISILNELDKLDNVTYRGRKLQNLWGINKDYEEVVVCVLSKKEVGGLVKTEIAGIGSIIQEHIKIFVPILEDAWMGAQKDIYPGIRSVAASHPSKIQPISQPKPQPESKPKTQPGNKSAQQKTQKPKTPLKTQPTPQREHEPQGSQPIEEKSHTVSTQPKSQFISQSKPAENISRPEPQQPIKSEPKPQPVSQPQSYGKELSGDKSVISESFNEILHNLEKFTGHEISTKLDNLKKRIEETIGYTGILKPMNLTINTLRFNKNRLDPTYITQLRNKIEFWLNKLNL
ncbi:MAG: hypothetical protein GF383_14700 [Candidatus Lokiarchaeota archaeon]|nr:hypothetical protein [Candidatus Lokiarchaeota archaeon]MBD3342665.1 hypothetical protein [Candidatus Lokiarchaeota archaeon]